MKITHLILSGQFAIFIVEFCFVSDRWGEESVQIDKPSTLVLSMIIVILIMIIIMINDDDYYDDDDDYMRKEESV